MTSGKKLTHLDSRGQARMVDVGAKPVTARRAVASSLVTVAPGTLDRIREGDLPKGDALAVARIAGVMAAKRTPTLIPLCHPIPLDQVRVEATVERNTGGVRILTEVRTHASTGVEMEALTAAAVAALALVDMVKGIDRTASLAEVRLELKEGGKSGRWTRDGFRELPPESNP